MERRGELGGSGTDVLSERLTVSEVWLQDFQQLFDLLRLKGLWPLSELRWGKSQLGESMSNLCSRKLSVRTTIESHTY